MARLPRFGFGPRAPIEAVAEEAVVAPQGYKPSFMEMFDAVAGGQTITDARKGLMAEHQAQQEAATNRQRIAELKRQVLTNPLEELAFLANAGEWGKAVASNRQAANVEGGSTRIMPGFGQFSAPKVFEAGDSIISAVPGESMEVLGKRDPSFKEQNDVEIKDRLADIREMLAGSSIANTRSMIAKRSQPAGGGRGASASRPGRGLNTGRILGPSLPEGY